MVIKDKQQTVYMENFLIILSHHVKVYIEHYDNFMKNFRTISLFNKAAFFNVKIYNQPVIFEGWIWGNMVRAFPNFLFDFI